MAEMHATLLSIYGLPAGYFGISYKDMDMSATRQDAITKKIKNAPNDGTLTVQGTAAPIVNQLLTQGRKIRGISFTERSSTAFETHQNPTADVVVLYDVGAEVSLNGKVSGMVLANIVKYYSSRKTLLIIETDMTKTALLSRYDFNTTNFIKIIKKEKENWI